MGDCSYYYDDYCVDLCAEERALTGGLKPVDRKKFIEQLENEAIATDAGYVEVPLFIFREIIALLKEQDEEIAFLKAMQLQTVHNMSNEDIGNAVRNVLRL